MRTAANAMSVIAGPNLTAISSSMAAADAIAGREVVPFSTMYAFRDDDNHCLRALESKPIHLLSNNGSAIASNVATHMAIGGNGLFVVKDSEDNVGYTRVGTFDVDGTLKLKNHLGQTLQVVMRDASGNISDTAGTLSDADFSTLASNPQATTSLAFKQVLPGNSPITGAPLDPPQDVTIYDTLGNGRRMQLSWERVANVAGAAAAVHHTWRVRADMDGTYGSIPAASPYNNANGVFVEFDASGNPLNFKIDDGGGGYTASPTAPDLAVQWNGVTVPNAIAVDFGAIGSSSGIVSHGYEFKMTQDPIKDGHAPGNFHKMYVDQDGYGWVTFTNGERQKQFRIPLAQINNYNGMLGVRNSVYYTTNDSGAASFYYPKQEGLGGILPEHYESSSVVQTEQYVRLIEAQKALMMQTKSFNTSKNMIDTLVTRLT